MNKKVLLIILFSLAIGLLGGCQLAKEGEQDGTGENAVGKDDKFIGVYISYVEDDTNIEVGSLAKYADKNGKVYAKLEEVDNSEEFTSHEFVFEGGEGISFFESLIPERLTGVPDYISGSVSKEMIGNKVNISISTIENEKGNIVEEATKVDMEGKLYFTEEVIVYANPVYQEPDGEVYCLWGTTGEHISNQASTAKLTLGDEESTLVKLNMSCRSLAGDVTFIALNEESQIISTEKYNANDVPENLNVPEGTEYFLVKSEFDGEDSELSVYSKENKFIDIVKNGVGIVMENSTSQLIWAE